MIDIHCHILPNFDDGSCSMEESLEMARMAFDSGVTGIVATPHFPGEPSSIRRLGTLMDRFQALDEALCAESIPVKLYHGAEILCLSETAQLARQRRLPTIGDTDYLLTEFRFDASGTTMTRMLNTLLDAGYKPVVAHPERYGAVQQDPRLAAHWFGDLQCVLQLNKGSVLGAFGSHVQETSRLLLNQGLAHIIASDAHSSHRRTPHMTQLRMWLEANCSPEYVQILLERNPTRLISGRPMVPVHD